MGSEKTWLDAHHGWDTAKPLETHWVQDPAVDQDCSELVEYFRTLDPSHLVMRPDHKPVRMVVRLPTPVQWAPIRAHLQRMESRLPDDGEFIAACIEAVELCVRFPDVESAEPVFRGGFRRLPLQTMRVIVSDYPSLPTVVGSWVIANYQLTDEEKKASSPASGPKTSSPSPTTDATDAPRSGAASKGAQTSGRKRARKPATD